MYSPNTCHWDPHALLGASIRHCQVLPEADKANWIRWSNKFSASSWNNVFHLSINWFSCKFLCSMKSDCKMLLAWRTANMFIFEFLFFLNLKCVKKSNIWHKVYINVINWFRKIKKHFFLIFHFLELLYEEGV